MEIINNKTESETLLNCFRIKKVEEIDILVGYCRYSAFYDIANDEIATVFLKKTKLIQVVWGEQRQAIEYGVTSATMAQIALIQDFLFC